MTNEQPRKDVSRSWMAGLIVMVAVAVSYVGFARVSVTWTLVVATLILVALFTFLWVAGVRKQRRSSGGR